MQFPARDLTNQYISSSYQDVTQNYYDSPSTTWYFLDGYGNVLFSLPSASYGNDVITIDQTASYAQISNIALIAEVALLADTASIAGFADFSLSSSWASSSISASWAPGSSGGGTTLYTASTYQITSSWAQQAILSIAANFADYAQYAETASLAQLAIAANFADYAQYAETSSVTTSASFANFATSASWAPAAGLIPGGTYPITASWAVNTVNGGGGGSSTSSSWASASLSSSYANTASYAFTSSYETNIIISSSFSQTASYLNGWTFDNITTTIPVTQSNVVISQRFTGSFTSVHCDYDVSSGSSARAGELFGRWLGGNVVYSDYSTVDFGDTDEVTMSIVLNGNTVEITANAGININWQVKVLARYL